MRRAASPQMSFILSSRTFLIKCEIEALISNDWRYSLYYAQIKFDEIKEMIETVDKNGDGKISYSEFRVMMGAVPLVMN